MDALVVDQTFPGKRRRDKEESRIKKIPDLWSKPSGNQHCTDWNCSSGSKERKWIYISGLHDLCDGNVCILFGDYGCHQSGEV